MRLIKLRFCRNNSDGKQHENSEYQRNKQRDILLLRAGKEKPSIRIVAAYITTYLDCQA
jgi:hypothetical protein